MTFRLKNNHKKVDLRNRAIFKNSQLQMKFTGSYKKGNYLLTETISTGN